MWRTMIGIVTGIALSFSVVGASGSGGMRAQVVAVRSCNENGECWGGAAVPIAFVGEYTVMITAEHIFSRGKDCNVSVDGGKSWVGCVVKATVGRDQVLIHTVEPIVDRTWKEISPWGLTFGDPVELYGYPGKGWKLHRLKGRVIEVHRERGVVLVQVEAWPWEMVDGFSGGPAVFDGKVFGTISQAIRMPCQHHVIVVSILWAFLSVNDCRLKPTACPQSLMRPGLQGRLTAAHRPEGRYSGGEVAGCVYGPNCVEQDLLLYRVWQEPDYCCKAHVRQPVESIPHGKGGEKGAFLCRLKLTVSCARLL